MSTFSTKRILLVDDSRAFCARVVQIVNKNYGELRAVYSAKEALTLVETWIPDILVTDLEMPETDGYAFVKRIRQEKQFCEIPILVLTGKDSVEITTKAIEAGADAFMSKSAVRESLNAHLLALARLRQTYQVAAKGKQLDAIKALIGTYKHEFVNALTAMDGKLRKFKRENPAAAQDESLSSVFEWLDRMQIILEKLSNLRDYEEENTQVNP